MNYFKDYVYSNKQYKYRKDTDLVLEKEIDKILLNGIEKKAVDFVLNHQLTKTTLWDAFVEQYSLKSDSAGLTWKGEYFGKMMRGGVFMYKITNDNLLYETLKKACLDLVKCQEDNGRISTYSVETEFDGWDMWCRKYVMLGFEYFLEIVKEKQTKQIILNSLIRHADYILSHIGKDKKDILKTSYEWGCVNSCSILEPMVKLYNLTNDKKYLDFANYIKDSGGSFGGNLIKIALEDAKYPFQYPTTKAYEIMSFFEGVAELYSVTKEENLKTAFLNFTNKIIESDYTIIGCAGCTNELFDNSTNTQSLVHHDVMQETCVTVTIMKLFIRALSLTGDSKYANLIEKSYYNAMIGAINFNQNDKLYWGKEYKEQVDYTPSENFIKSIHGLTFDSYSPLIKDARCKKTGGYQLLKGNKAYGCCACIGSTGVATLPLYAIMQDDDGLTFNFYIGLNGNYYSPTGQKVNVCMETNYPYEKNVKIKIDLENEEEFSLKLRIPDYVNSAFIDKKKVDKGCYYVLTRKFHHDTIVIDFDYDYSLCKSNDRVAITNGIITYAIDNRIEDIDKLASDNIVSITKIDKEINCQDEILVKFDNGNQMKMIDYASSGAIYNQGKNLITVWMEKE